MGTIITEASVITDDIETLERLKKEKEYYEYIQKHVKFVVEAFERYILPLKEMNNICSTVDDASLYAAIDKLADRIGDHDASKYLDAEFYPYRAKYYPTANESKGDSDAIELMEDKYREAWKHHYTHNSHHPEFWINDDGTIRDMELDSILEMICDWNAVSNMFGGNVVDWYKNEAVNDEQKAMTQKTRDIVEDLMYNVLYH